MVFDLPSSETTMRLARRNKPSDGCAFNWFRNVPNHSLFTRYPSAIMPLVYVEYKR